MENGETIIRSKRWEKEVGRLMMLYEAVVERQKLQRVPRAVRADLRC